MRDLIMAINEHAHQTTPESRLALHKTARNASTLLRGLEILAAQNIAASCAPAKPVSFTTQKTMETVQ